MSRTSPSSQPVSDKNATEIQLKQNLLNHYKLRSDRLELPWGDRKTSQSNFMKALLASFKNRHAEYRNLITSSSEKSNTDSLVTLSEKLKNSYHACLAVSQAFDNAQAEIAELKTVYAEKQHAHRIGYTEIYEATRKIARYDAKNPEYKLFYQNTGKVYTANMIFESILAETDKIISINDFQNKLHAQDSVCTRLLALLHAQMKTLNDSSIKNITPVKSIEDFAEFENGAKCPGLTITPPSPTPPNITPDAKTDETRTSDNFSPARSSSSNSSNNLQAFFTEGRQSAVRMAQQSRKNQPAPRK